MSESEPVSSEPVQPPLSCPDIARILDRDNSSIWRAVRRLGIAPVLETTKGYRFYDPGVVEVLRTNLRKAPAPRF